ncbi:MAG: ATP-dependent DNA ligase [Candidatus Pacearchaeota archaeon]
MKFSKFSEYLEKLEKTNKRLEMFEILSQLFKEADKSEVDEIVYFCEEQLVPPFKGIEIGMAEKMVEKAIVKVTGRSEKEVNSEYKKLGDLGLVIEKISGKQSTLFKSKAVTIEEVYQQLMRIAQTTGEGSVDKKIAMLAGLLSRCSGLENRYIIRFVLGRLRLGIGDPTLMDSMSKVLTGDRMKLREDIERAYNLCSDLGKVANVLFNKGIKGLKEFKVEVGSPIRMALAERLPSAEEIIKKIGKCAVETKYDGLRLQVHKQGDKVELFSRNLERMTHMFPDVVEGIKKQVKLKNAILEGEAVAFNEETGEFFPFQVTITRKRKYKVEEMAKEFPLVLFSFDLLYNGKDLTQEKYLERRKKLEQAIKKGFTIRISDMIITDNPKELENFFEENVEKGTEGIIAKRLDSEYQAGARNFNWIKLKRSYKGELQDTIDVVIVGYLKGKGIRAKFGIGALLGAVYDEKSDSFKTVAKIGSGLSEEKWVEIRKLLDKIKVEKKPVRVDSLINVDVWCSPKYVFTVRADEITKSPIHTAARENEVGLALRFPRIEGWIRDKKPEDCTSVKELKEMFKMQKKVKAISLGT